MFNYVESTDDELLHHITNSTSNAISVAKIYHQGKGNFEVVARIDKARKVLKMQRMRERAEVLEKEMMEGGN